MVDPRETSMLNASVSDQAAAKDALGFAPYVTAMAEFLTNPQTKPPLTLSVEGEWGSGKSSFMKQLKQAIEESSQKELKKKLEGVEKWVRRSLYKIFYAFPNNLEQNSQPLGATQKSGLDLTPSGERFEKASGDIQWRFLKRKMATGSLKNPPRTVVAI